MTDNLLPFRRSERSERPDGDLVSECADGNREALDELFRRHGERVRRILIRLRYVDQADLDDVVQTTFLEMQQSAKRFTGRATVGTWIVGIAMNVVRHYVRAETRRRSAMTVVAGTPHLEGGAGPHELAVHRQFLARLVAGFDSLPETLRIVFTLCDLENMRSIDVARALNVAEGTVWKRLHLARRRLRAFLNGEGGT
jgi:RNA polymerase sigma-70 factor (ECF subfamily)